MRLFRVGVCIIVACLIGGFASAQVDQQQSYLSASTATVPRLIRTQGTVRDETGKPLSGAIGITFTLYRDQNDQQAVWQEIQNVQLNSNGHYSVLLGATNEAGLPLEIFSVGEARWLGVRPDGYGEQPRILLLSVAYALKAADAETLGGKPASAYVLANTQSATVAASANSQIPTVSSAAGPLLVQPQTAQAQTVQPQTACAAITSDGTATVNQLTKFTTACNIENSAIFESGGNVGIGNTAPAGTLDVSGTSLFRGALTFPPAGTATSSQGFNSSPTDYEASVYNSVISRAQTYIFQWQAEPSGNNTSNTGSTLNLLYGVPGVVSETGLSIARTGIITFASGQTFPGSSGTVTNVATGAGLTGGPITTTGTISIPSAGVTNAMLANSSVTVKAGTGLSGGGAVALGGTVTLSSTATGTVTDVATGAGLTGGPITTTGTISIPSAGVTNAMLTNSSVTVKAGTGLSGGGTVALGGTITLTNSAPSSGGTVTSVASGTGLTGGPITGSGTLSLNTTFTDARYLQLSGGTLTGAISGTTAAFTTGTFSSALTAAGAVMPTTGTATASKGFNSNPFDLQASSFSSGTSKAVVQDFRWVAEPAANDSALPSGTLNLQFGSNGTAPTETGLSIASNGVIKFASGQTFPGSGGSGTVTSVNTGAGLTGGPITSSGTISIPSAGVTNTMLANPSITVQAGPGLSGGGTVALGGTVTLASTATGTVTSVNTGSGLTGGPITSTGTISITSAGVTNAMLANNSVTVKAGTGLSGGGTVALGGTVTLSSTSSGGTVTSVASGTGLTGGPITSSGTLNLDTTFTDARYLQLTGGVLSGSLTGTSAAFTAGLSASSGIFTGSVSSGGNVLPQTGAATATQGFNSNTLDLQASSFNSTSSTPVTQDFRWQAEPAGNNSANPSGSLNLLFGSNGNSPAETGLSIANNGLITFATGQTFPGGSGSGTVTSVNTGAGLTGGPITSSGTISIPAAGVTNSMLANPSLTVQAGAGLSGGGTVALGGTVTLASNLSGTSNGLAYFSNPTTLTSTPAPTNGQLLIGSTGSAPTLATLSAGPNVSITNGPGSITISATGGGGGGAPTLPFFITAGARNGTTQAATLNVTKLWGFLLPYNVTTTEITYSITTKDSTANDYDIGIFNSSGTLIVNLGATPGTTFAPTAAFHTLTWTQGSTALAAGKYYLGFTTNCSATCAAIGAVGSYVSFAANTSAGASVGGALPTTITPPADAWVAGNQPVVVIQ